MQLICKSQYWFWTVISLVFLNTLCASIEHADQPDWLDQFLKLAEIVFLSLFIIYLMVYLTPKYRNIQFSVAVRITSGSQGVEKP